MTTFRSKTARAGFQSLSLLALCGLAGTATATAPADRGTPLIPPGFEPVVQTFQASNLNNMALLIGDRNGVFLRVVKGNLDLDQTYTNWSATKMLTGLTIASLVEDGVLSYQARPQDLLSFWTTSPTDNRSRANLGQLISMTAGFDNLFAHVVPCLTDGNSTLSACGQIQYNTQGALFASNPGTTFYYGTLPHYTAGLMAEAATGQSFQALLRTRVLDPAGASAGTGFGNPSQTHHRPDGGVVGRANDYALILTALLDGRIIDDLAAFATDRTVGVNFIVKPAAPGGRIGDWHYATGVWLECDDAVFSARCAQEPIISSTGAWGWTPWVDLRNQYWGLLAIVQPPNATFPSPAITAIDLEQQLQPLIVPARIALDRIFVSGVN